MFENIIEEIVDESELEIPKDEFIEKFNRYLRVDFPDWIYGNLRSFLNEGWEWIKNY